MIIVFPFHVSKFAMFLENSVPKVFFYLLNSYEESHKMLLMLFAFPNQNQSGFNFSLCLGS